MSGGVAVRPGFLRGALFFLVAFLVYSANGRRIATHDSMGTALLPFLVGISAFFVQLVDDPTAALDALGLPEHLRHPEDPDAAALRRWADPALGNPEADPYVAAFGPDVLEWARVVPVSGPAQIDVVVAPVGESWLVIGASMPTA